MLVYDLMNIKDNNYYWPGSIISNVHVVCYIMSNVVVKVTGQIELWPYKSYIYNDLQTSKLWGKKSLIII